MSKLINASRLRKKLQNYQKKTINDAIRKGSRAGCKVILPAAKEKVPSKTGATRASLKVRALPRSRKWIGTQVRAQVFYVGFPEYGTKYIKPKHSMKQASDSKKASAMATAINIIREEIVKGANG